MDEAADGLRVGGTVGYAGRAALTLGARLRVLTSGSLEHRQRIEESLHGAEIQWVESRESTVFRNAYAPDGRRTQHILSEASYISPEALPDAWASAQVVHLAPMAGELSSEMIAAIDGDSLIGITPQGWLRRRLPDGLVTRREWHDYRAVLDRADAVVFSEDDVADTEEAMRYANAAKLAVITRAVRGADVVENGRITRVPAYPACEVDPTGAGDVFAAAFFLEYRRTGSPVESARFASSAASFLVERPGIDGLASEVAVRKRMSDHEARS